jgi:hypothetical protein
MQTIQVYDMPRRVRAGLITLLSNSEDESLTNGNIVSEVGDPKMIRLACYERPFLTFQLRAARKQKMASHMFGKLSLGEAFSAMIPRIFPAPAVGATLVIDPVVTPQQASIAGLYENIAADFVYILHVASPLGAAIALEVFAPESDRNTKTRGVRWRPAGQNSIAVMLPWSSDISTVKRATGRVGQSGGSIIIRTFEDNSQISVNTPLNITVFSAVINIRCNSLIRNDLSGTIPGLNFIPVPAPEINFEQQADSGTIEVNAEGAADLPEQIAPDGPEATLTTEVEKPQSTPTKPDAKAKVTRKPQAGVTNSKWVEGPGFTIGAANFLVWQELYFDPYTSNSNGESLSRPYRRNVWVTGSTNKGYLTTLRCKIMISKPPSISGVIEISDSRNNSSSYYVAIGGNVELDLIPENYSGSPSMSRPRYWTSPFLRTDEAGCRIRYRIIAFNRTTDIADVQVRVLWKLGSSQFHVPTKPRPTTNNLVALYREIRGEIDYEQQCDISSDQLINKMAQGIDNMTFVGGEDNDADNEDYITSAAGESGFSGVVDLEDNFNEDLDQDDFGTLVWKGMLPNNGRVVIPLNLAVIQDLEGGGGLSVIAEKFERNAHICPTSEGAMGPSVGAYTIETRLPTDMAGNISHVLLPGDMSDEAALFAFDLSNILSIATGALQAVGGPLMSAAISTGRMLFNKIQSIGGKESQNNNTATANPPSLSGSLDLSRFMSFLKPNAVNEALDPTMPSLLVQAQDFINSSGIDVAEIPARLWAKMGSAGIERQLWDRLIAPQNTMINEVYICKDRYPYIIERFGSHKSTFIKGSYQNECFVRFLAQMRKNGLTPTSPNVTIKGVLEYTPTQAEYEACDQILYHGASFAAMP